MNAERITRNLGGRWRGGAGSAACPICQPERRRDQTALSLRDGDNGVLLFCHKGGCNFADIAEAVSLPREATLPDPLAMAEARRKRAEYDAARLAKARAEWERGKPIQETKAETYLRSRGIVCPLPDSLRFIPDTMHLPSGRWVSAMVADVQPTGGVHRTYLDKATGAKLKGDNAKMMLGPCGGGAVRLSERAGPLVICEGIETGLSLLQSLSGRSPRVWAALSTSGIRGLILSAEPGELIVAPDGDAPGREAAAALAERASALGWNVRVMDPGDGLDWNDHAKAGAAA